MTTTFIISLIIIAIVQMIKMALPNVKGWLTIIVAFLVSILISVLSFVVPTEVLGIDKVTIADALVAGLTSIGITVAASKAGGGAKGDETQPSA